MSSTLNEEINIIGQYLTDLKRTSTIDDSVTNKYRKIQEVLDALKSAEGTLQNYRTENEKIESENKILIIENDKVKKQIELDKSAKKYGKGRLKDATEVLMSLAALDLDRQALISENEDEYDGLSVGLNMLGQELKASTVSINYLDDIFESMTEILLVINKNGIIESINEAGKKVFGTDIKNQDVSKIIYAKDDPNAKSFSSRGIATLINTGDLIQIEIEVSDKNGNLIPLEILLSPMRSREEVVFIGRNITERKNAQTRQAKLLHELEDSNKELRQFAYITSHDLKAPLRAISVLCQLIHEDSNDVLSPASKNNFELLVSRVKRMHGFLEGVLSYSKIGLDKEMLSSIDLNLIVKEVLNYIEVPNSINVLIKSQLPTIEASKIHMIQLYQNLISNAIKYMDKTSGEIEIGVDSHNDEDRLYVKDNGIGIKESHYEKIFIIFQTLVPRDTIESTGIGLTIVKKIVEQYGGKISLESELGKGTCFYFTLN